MAAGYGSPEEAFVYHSEKGNTAWIDSNEDLQIPAMSRGSDWIDRTYRQRFPGTKTGGRAQAREWPREDATDIYGVEIPDDEVPTEILEASYEAALRELITPGILSPDYSGSTNIKSESKTVGSISKSVTYFDSKGDPYDARPVYYTIDGILEPILLPGTGSKSTVVFLQRA